MEPAPGEMTGAELLAAASANAREILHLSGSIKGFPVWDRWMITMNTGLALAGLIFAPPTGGASLALTVISALLLAAEVTRKARDLTLDAEVRARLLTLEARNEELLAEIKRRLH